MKVRYTRVSSILQSTERQKVNTKDFLLVEDKCSGSIPFFEREGGKKIQKLVNKGEVTLLSVHAIDRLGRNLQDILNTIDYFSKKKIPIYFETQGLQTLDENGNESHIANLIISILGSVAQMERAQLKERQREGIEIAKMKGIYKGRQTGATEDPLKFINKRKNKDAKELLEKGVKVTTVVNSTGLSMNTVYKIKKYLKALREVA